MGLTRIKAQQISDIDYKQAVRVITVATVTLTGGAPSQVDGVNLMLNDRVLVTGQDTASENGLYYVATLGTGSDGTWTRTADGDVTGEIEAGMIVMATEGTVYRDTQWKLTTNDPIIIGTTALIFEQNTGFAFGNIVANGTALANAVGGTVTLSRRCQPQANKLLIFDARRFHASTSPCINTRRCVLNVVYQIQHHGKHS